MKKLCDFLFGAAVTPHKDHDMANLKESKTSSSWEHTYVCPKCISPVGHHEFMTEICLSCGQQMGRLPDSAARRRVVLEGAWRDTIRLGSTDYVKNESGDWVRVNEWLRRHQIADMEARRSVRLAEARAKQSQ